MAEVCAMASRRTDELAKASLPVGDSLIAWVVFQWIIRRIDDYGRWEAFMSLQQYSGFFSDPLFTPCALVAAILLLLVYQQVSLNRALAVPAPKRILDANSEEYFPRISYAWFWVTLCVIATSLMAGALFSILWLRFYTPPIPSSRQIVRVPPICKTVDCWPKPSAHPRPNLSVKNITTAPYSPVVSGSGNIINYSNIGPESASAEQKKDIRIALSHWMALGETLRDRCSSDPPTSQLDTEANEWFQQVDLWLRSHLDISFDIQFKHVTPSPLGPPSRVPSERDGLWRGINERVETLNKFIDEFK